MSTETTDTDTSIDETLGLIDRRINFIRRLMDPTLPMDRGRNLGYRRRIENLEAAKARIVGPPNFITALANTLTDTERTPNEQRR